LAGLLLGADDWFDAGSNNKPCRAALPKNLRSGFFIGQDTVNPECRNES